MDLKVALVIFLVVGCYVDTSGASYATEVETFFKGFSSTYNIGGCITKAKNKMNQFSYKSDDQKYAIAMVNLYTQECRITFNMYNTVSFYSALNKKMREGATGMWRTAGDLMNRAIGTLGEMYVNVVYRGCSHNIGGVGTVYMFNMITSTSTDPKVSMNFLGYCGTLFIIENVRGTSVSRYSVYAEDEVLLKSTNRFDVSKETTSATDIQTKMKELGITGPLRRIIYLDMKADVSGASVNVGITSPTLSIIGVIIFHYAMLAVIF